MATIYDQTIGVIDYPQYWQWHIVITSVETSTQYKVTVSATLTGTTSFSLDLQSKDIWWTINFDGSSAEAFRVYRSNGQYQTLNPGTYGPYTLTKTYDKSSSGPVGKNVSVSVTGSATYYTNMLGITDQSVSFTIPTGYKAPSGFSISVDSNTSTSVKVKASWTNGTKSATSTISIGNKSVNISNGGTGEITGLTPNTSYSISGSLTDGTTTLTASTTVLTDIVSPSSWTTATSNTNSITVAATSSNGGNFKYQYRIQKNGSWSSWQDSGTFGSLSSNTNYPLQARCINTDNSNTSGTLDGSMWTYPVINTPSLSLKSGSEHNTINVSVSASVASNYDQFAYKLGNGSWSSYTTSKSHSFGSLSGNTKYTIYVKMKNTSSSYESAEASASITTWYNPLTGLTVNLVNRWFWYLQINCSYTYSGTITKYEFAIGDDQAWQIKSGNSYSRGSINPGASGNLAYNTDYGCWVKLTDNYGRTYSYTGQGTTYEFANARKVFKTLDERPLYVNGALREVKVIKPDGSVHYITPNLLTVVKPDGSTTNMNKIINNDNRTSYQ